MKSIRPYVPKRQRQSLKSTKDSVASCCNETTKRNKEDECQQTAGSEGTLTASDKNLTSPECPDNSSPPSPCTKNYVPKVCINTAKIHRNAVNCVRWSKDSSNSLLLSVSMDSSIGIWSFSKENGTLVREINVHGGAVKDARWSRDGLNILSGGYDKTARITDAETGNDF